MAHVENAAHPVTPDVIWNRDLPVARDAAELHPQQIAEAAFTVADRENLQAVSLKRVAAKLGVAPIRLQSYVTSKDDLFDLMLDVAYGELAYPEPNADRAAWREDLRAIAHATQQTARRHPWLMLLVGSRPPCGPNGLRNSERTLGAVDGLGLDISTMAQLITTLLAYVYGFVQIELLQPSHDPSLHVDAEHHQATARYLIEAVGNGSYPTLSRLFATQPNAQDAFEVGLEYVLDGIGARIAAGSAAAS